MLHAISMTIPHPVHDKILEIKADLPSEFERMLSLLNLSK
jgi:hypothetical protein